MKKTFLTLCAGILIGVFVGAATGADAAIGDRVEAVFAKYNFVVNGEIVEIDADPLVYQGSTYLPVRSLLNTLGYDVGYVADSRTITIDKNTEALAEEIEKILGGESMERKNREVPLEEQIGTVDARIRLIENRLRLREVWKTNPTITEEHMADFGLDDAGAEKLREELADLLQQKEELEAELRKREAAE